MKELDLSTIASQESFINYCFQNNSEDVLTWENWLKENSEYKEQIAELKTSILLLPIPASEKVIDHDYQKLQNNIAGLSSTTRTYKLWPFISGMVAAVAIIILGVYLYKYKQDNNQQNQTNNFANDITPGKQGATLTLASGKKIQLSNAANGQLAKESGVVITKTATGELIYEIQDNTESSRSTNILSTAKGETYQVVLPDGSKVWLNAASTLKYPAKFTALKQRRVQLDGEAYFEIAKDKLHPFIVETDKQSVEVLGTHFNINSYQDEPDTKTTLLEGSVKVATLSGRQSTFKQLQNSTVLKPGEQSVLSGAGKIDVMAIDVNKATAWKNGKFVFEEENIESIMRKLSRWYNVEIIYQGDFTNKTFVGSISRSDNISKILDKITFTQAVHFKIEGRRIYVMQ